MSDAILLLGAIILILIQLVFGMALEEIRSTTRDRRAALRMLICALSFGGAALALGYLAGAT